MQRFKKIDSATFRENQLILEKNALRLIEIHYDLRTFSSCQKEVLIGRSFCPVIFQKVVIITVIRCDYNDQLIWYELHWVSSILKPLEHAGKKQEVLAISFNIKKQENLQSIVQLEEGEGNAQKETQRILQVLDELGISRIFIICPGFDTTS